MTQRMVIYKWLNSLGRYLELMGRTFQRPERMRMFFKEYLKEMAQLGVNSIGIVLLISFFIGAVICIQPHTCGQGGLEHSLRNRHDARHPAD